MNVQNLCFGSNTIIPSINKEIKKREEVLEFANNSLFINTSINLSTFKEVIYRMIAIKKYEINISDQYLNHYFYNWRNRNRINTFYYAHDNPNHWMINYFYNH